VKDGGPIFDAMEGLVECARAETCAGAVATPPDPEAGTLAARIVSHARDVVSAGGGWVDALDSALVLLMFAGEREALRQRPDGDPVADPLGVRPVLDRLAGWTTRVRGDAPSTPPGLVNRSHNLQIMTTRRCQLRCTYCPVVKRDADTPLPVIERASRVLLGSSHPEIRLDFTGGEPLLRWDVLRGVCARACEEAGRRGKTLGFYMVTNGFLLDRPTADTLADLGFRVELSLDGEESTHNRCKKPLEQGENPYERTVRALECALEAGLDHTVVMVVSPETVDGMGEGFAHAVALGARCVDVNYAIGRFWSDEDTERFIAGLVKIVEEHAETIRRGAIEIGNLGSRVEPAVLNGEWMVETDGTLHLMTEWALESSRPADAPDLSGGRIDDIGSWDDLWSGRSRSYETLLRTYSWRNARLRKILHNNIVTGRRVSRALARARSAP